MTDDADRPSWKRKERAPTPISEPRPPSDFQRARLQREKFLALSAERRVNELVRSLAERRGLDEALAEFYRRLRKQGLAWSERVGPLVAGRDETETHAILTRECQRLLEDTAKDLDRARQH